MYTKEDIIKKFNNVHGNNYDYSEVNFKKVFDKVIIICPIHGKFEKTAVKHYGGQGCPKCSIKNTVNIKVDKACKEFQKKANSIHNNIYNYDKVLYKDSKDNVIITCPIHGDFEQKPYHHLQGSGCQKCGRNRSENFKKVNREHYISLWNRVHSNKYSYDNVDYTSSDEKVLVTCKEHGDFKVTPGNHREGKGCPKCVSIVSKPEIELQNFLKIYIKIESNKRDLIHNKEIDVYIPSKKLAIEFNGLYWHSDLFKDKNFHIEKTKMCKEKEVQLIHVFEDEWKDKKEIVKSRLLNIIGKTENKIFARKCHIKNVTTTEAMKFLDKNHIQGRVGAAIKIGLYYNEDLVALMTFGGLRISLGGVKKEGSYELLRFCNKLNTNVIGGASKLLKYFEKSTKPKSLVSYADRRWSTGNLYEQLNFNLIHLTPPNYFYTKGRYREGRFKYRKDKLVSEGYDKELTEREIMNNRGYYRIYDCGVITYVKEY